MKTKLPFGLLLIVTITGCGPSGTGATTPAAPITQNTPPQVTEQPAAAADVTKPDASIPHEVAAASDCPATTFAEFVPLFFDNADNQEKYTVFPLTQISRDEETGSDFVHVAKDMYDGIAFPFPSLEENSALSWEVDSQDQRNVTLRVWLDGSGQLTHYVFEKDGCWKLVRIEDRGA